MHIPRKLQYFLVLFTFRMSRCGSLPRPWAVIIKESKESYSPLSQCFVSLCVLFLEQRKAKDWLGIEGDEESTMYEDNVTPAQ